ncbi:MAG: choice-of-anchor J domain-containing protein, partial [Planctomycetes bacterium]|nr:choice-of-anchor J domain-containing protein [Planctomycetota bacterium]
MRIPIGTLLCCWALWSPLVHAQVVLEEDFESGAPGWTISDGVWEYGSAVYGPPTPALSGTSCASTVLDADYPNAIDSRLITPTFLVEPVDPGEEVVLEFFHFFQYAAPDAGRLQYRVVAAGGAFGPWLDLELIGGAPAVFGSYSQVWSPTRVDLTFIGVPGPTEIQIAFLHDVNTSSTAAGWSIDDVTVSVASDRDGASFTTGFESGWDGWSTTSGIWEIGSNPIGAPGGVLEGSACIGTILSDTNGLTPNGIDSRLISPVIQLPSISGANEEVLLRFGTWHEYVVPDLGALTIQRYDALTGAWGSWEPLGITVQPNSMVWYPLQVDLSADQGRRVRLGFLHDVNTSSPSNGWVVDALSIDVRAVPASFAEDFESGIGEWSVRGGIWEVGAPPTGSAIAPPGGCIQGQGC